MPDITLMIKDPRCFYAYWEIPEKTKIDFINDFGDDLWNRSVPALKVTNITKKISYFVEINDYSSNWYIGSCEPGNYYFAEIGRKIPDTFFISFSASNLIVTPNGNISSNTSASFADYRDIKNIKYTLEVAGKTGIYGLESGLNAISGISSADMYGTGTG